MIALLIGTNIYWAFQMHRLINKLMARSLHEYVDAVSPPKKQKKPDLEHEPVFDDTLGAVTEIF